MINLLDFCLSRLLSSYLQMTRSFPNLMDQLCSVLDMAQFVPEDLVHFRTDLDRFRWGRCLVDTLHISVGFNHQQRCFIDNAIMCTRQ